MAYMFHGWKEFHEKRPKRGVHDVCGDENAIWPLRARRTSAANLSRIQSDKFDGNRDRTET